MSDKFIFAAIISITFVIIRNHFESDYMDNGEMNFRGNTVTPNAVVECSESYSEGRGFK